MRTDMIEIGDTVEFKIENVPHRAFIQKLNKVGMSVKVVEKNGERALFGDFEPFHLDICEDLFDAFNLEIWSDGRGGDNSAIGVSGCHEPWDRVWILSSQL